VEDDTIQSSEFYRARHTQQHPGGEFDRERWVREGLPHPSGQPEISSERRQRRGRWRWQLVDGGREEDRERREGGRQPRQGVRGRGGVAGRPPARQHRRPAVLHLRRRREAARLRVHGERQPGPVAPPAPQARATAGLADQAAHRRRRRQGPQLHAPRLHEADHPPRRQVQQHLARPRVWSQDRRLRARPDPRQGRRVRAGIGHLRDIRIHCSRYVVFPPSQINSRFGFFNS